MSPHSPLPPRMETASESSKPKEQQAGSPARGKIFTSSFLLVWLATFTSFGSFHLLWAVLPLYVLDMGGTKTDVGVVVGAFAAASLLTRPFVGQASDLRGRKVFLLVAAVTILMAALLYNFAHNILALLAVRIIHGAGWGAFSTITSALTADIAPERRRGEAIGYFGMASLISVAAWPAAGVFLQKSYGVTTVFYSTAVVALACFLASLPISERPVKKISSPRARHYALSHLFERSALFTSLIAGLLFVTHASIISFLPLVAKERGMGNPGLFFTVLAATGILGRSVTGRLSDRYGRGVMATLGMAAAASSLALLAFAHSLAPFLVSAALFGLALATVQPDLMALTIDRVAPQARGLAMSTYTTALDLGVWVGSLIWGIVAQYLDFTTMYLLAALVAVGGGVMLLINRLGGRKQTGVSR